MPGDPGTHRTWSSSCLSVSRVCLNSDVPMQMRKKCQSDNSMIYCTKNDFARATQFVFTSWGDPQIEVSLCISIYLFIYLLKWNYHIFLIFFLLGLELKVTLNCLHFMLFSRYLGSSELIHFSENYQFILPTMFPSRGRVRVLGPTPTEKAIFLGFQSKWRHR